jgi:hypothetical protein
MEFADQRQLAPMLVASAARGRPRRTRKSAGGPAAYEAPARKQRVRRCKCGTCASCRENERWERIFQEKFADPDYYLRSPIRCDSPLNALLG